MNRFCVFYVFLLFMPFFAGCACEHIGMPNLLHPGHISEQQDRMKRFDPFTRSDFGPKISGDRPHGCSQQTPIPEHLKEYPSEYQPARGSYGY